MRTLVLGAAAAIAFGALMMVASDVRSQSAFSPSTDLRFAALPTAAKAPADNPGTSDKIALGRLLFWDPILSGRNDVACATCHHPRFGYAENRTSPSASPASASAPRAASSGTALCRS